MLFRFEESVLHELWLFQAEVLPFRTPKNCSPADMQSVISKSFLMSFGAMMAGCGFIFISIDEPGQKFL